MDRKRKAATAQTPGFIERVVDTFTFAVLATSAAFLAAFLVTTMLQPTSDKSPYRFCLATESGDSCVHRPGIVIGSKIHKSPDKLLEFFGGIPERVQQRWRVWIMDVEHSNTTELTVAKFYAWIDGVWKAQNRALGGP